MRIEGKSDQDINNLQNEVLAALSAEYLRELIEKIEDRTFTPVQITTKMDVEAKRGGFRFHKRLYFGLDALQMGKWLWTTRATGGES